MRGCGSVLVVLSSSLLRPGTLPDQKRKIHLTHLFSFPRPPLCWSGLQRLHLPIPLHRPDALVRVDLRLVNLGSICSIYLASPINHYQSTATRQTYIMLQSITFPVSLRAITGKIVSDLIRRTVARGKNQGLWRELGPLLYQSNIPRSNKAR